MNKHSHSLEHGRDGFAMLVVMALILLVTAVAGYYLASSKNHMATTRRWEAADQRLLDAQSALERVKYEMIQAYGSNTQSSAAWFLNWSSNAIGTTPRYSIPSPVMVGATPVFVRLTAVTVTTNLNASQYNLTVVADAMPSGGSTIRRSLQEQMQVSVLSGSNSVISVAANSALSVCGSMSAWTVGGTLTVDGHNWNPPAVFNSGAGTLNSPSTNDVAGLRYDAVSGPIASGTGITIEGNPPQTNSTGACGLTYWNQFLNAATPVASLYNGGSYFFGNRTNLVITLMPAGATTIASARSGAGILIIPSGATIKFNQPFYFEGLMILGSGGSASSTFSANNTFTLYGGMVCLSSAGAWSVSVPGNMKVLYSRQAITTAASVTNQFSMTGAGTNGISGVPYTSRWRVLY